MLAAECRWKQIMGCSKKMKSKDPQSQFSEELQLHCTTTSNNFDLIPVLPNDITLGPIMAYMPWHMKPLLMTLNKTWAYALNNPQCAIPHYKPNALKNSVIFYAHTQIDNDNTLFLFIYQRGILRKLPPPPHISAESYKFTRFFVTDQCVYALTPCSAQDKDMYNVEMLDLGGGITRWQTLPQLPDIGDCIYITSMLNEDGNSTHDYIWICSDSIRGITEECIYLSMGHRVIMDDADDWSAWELHKITDKGQSRSIPPPPAPPIEKFENHPPEYLDIYSTDELRPRHLYKLFTVTEYGLHLNHQGLFEPTIEPGYLFLFKDDYYQGAITGLHSVRKEVDSDGSMKLISYRKDLQNAEVLAGDELNEFYDSWRNFLSNWRRFLPENISAVKFTSDLSQKMDEWQKQFSLPSSKGDGLVLNETSTVKVVQQGTIYIYAYIATKCTNNMYFQGDEQLLFS
ncbi:hypothetical protein SUGI_0571500 [Cryptomeria japonica]|uniref:uncharacterized protein LOC131028020 isoform X2 n=1 Tax=Cryptomeria japonica TaxID=3369 RepID=UPI002408CA20|nr:uncharacterized protein LOC131028020 isoform X2 [Cryptomeria japonica]GLJ28965.1 hypothetical protein SUGI_0571500 [Cryptomeria japonica]